MANDDHDDGRMRDARHWLAAAAVVLAALPCCTGFASQAAFLRRSSLAPCSFSAHLRTSRGRGVRGIGLTMTGAAVAAGATLRSAQEAALGVILAGGLGLEETEGFSDGGASVRAFVGGDVAWCSYLDAAGPERSIR